MVHLISRKPLPDLHLDPSYKPFLRRHLLKADVLGLKVAPAFHLNLVDPEP